MNYFVRRIAYLILIVVAVTLGVSVMLDLLPGDPAFTLIGEDATADQVARVRADLRLDDPVWERWIGWVGDALRGDLGVSYRTGRAVVEEIGDRIWVTVELVVLAQLAALVFAIGTSLVAAVRPQGLVDRVTRNISFLMLSTPSFVLALVLVLVFASTLTWFPIVGYFPPGDGLAAHLRSIALPVIAMSADPAGVYQRVLRSDLARTMSEDFVMMAWSKGLASWRVMLVHALRPSLFSLVTVAGITTARLIGGSVVIETIFGLPGVGRLLVDAISSRDLVVVQGIVAIVGLAYVLINSAVDISYGLLNPKVRRAPR